MSYIWLIAFFGISGLMADRRNPSRELQGAENRLFYKLCPFPGFIKRSNFLWRCCWINPIFLLCDCKKQEPYVVVCSSVLRLLPHWFYISWDTIYFNSFSIASICDLILSSEWNSGRCSGKIVLHWVSSNSVLLLATYRTFIRYQPNSLNCTNIHYFLWSNQLSAGERLVEVGIAIHAYGY